MNVGQQLIIPSNTPPESDEYVTYIVERGDSLYSIANEFDVTVDDGTEKKVFTLNRSYYGLYIPKGLWRTMDNFSTNSLALEFANTKYNRMDYIEDYDIYVKIKKDGKI